jgi:hypothetical protein
MTLCGAVLVDCDLWIGSAVGCRSAARDVKIFL